MSIATESGLGADGTYVRAAGASDAYDSASGRVGGYMAVHRAPGGSRRRAGVGVEGIMSADEILDLYRSHSHGTVGGSADGDRARLLHLERQANRDVRASRSGISSLLTRLLRDLRHIRASSLADYMSQLARVLSTDNRPFAAGALLVLVGLLGISTSRIGV